ncbi:hypothetical protein FZW96_03830 [Bacillus sp. BGMRC 2118]|nr:hypothetical protein FZW96_03830 [Bacillus sp. BGMRC 2118]
MRIYKSMFILLLLLLVGCTSIDEVVVETKDIVEKEFHAGEKGVNVETETFSYYKPTSMEIKDKGTTNIILTEGKQPYILFVNTLEKKNSQVVYESSQKNAEYLVHETFEHKDSFAFLQVLELDKNLYEVTVGVGGTKLTTETKKDKIADSAELMMQIANSVRVK